ncbi:nucleotide-binding oligomerization domain-containing protein 1-like [Montipora foliosa]|uniref:nucleotide-binding oligomerization domain-containing protein 1-like n=1 Tax=Montipora foliosa TaxID=591990 RepID=UPI0035F14E5A
MDFLREAFTPKTFNKLSFVLVLLWIFLGLAATGIFSEMEINEPRFDFRCDAKTNIDKDFIRGKCFDQYQKQFNKVGIPPYAFIIVNFSAISIVSLTYSQCVKSTVNRLEGGQEHAERQRSNPRRRRWLFAAYLSQLAAKFTLGIIFIVFLETELLYRGHFPADFTCLVKKSNDSGKLYTNQTQSTLHECINQRATNKNFWINAVTVVNGIFAFFAFVEIVWILSRAKTGRNFMDNRQFYIDHLRSNSDQQHEYQDDTHLGEVETGCPSPVQEGVDVQNTRSTLNTGESQVEMEHSELAPEELELTEAMEKIKDDCLNCTEQLNDLKQPFRRKPGEGPKPNDLNIDQIYVNVAMHEGRAAHVFAKDRREQLRQYPPDSKNCLYARPDDLINKQHKNILVVGRPGIGKTLLSTKILRMWASGEAFNTDQDDKTNIFVVFLMKFRRFTSNLVLSLRELLAKAETVERLNDVVWDFVIKNPSQVLFIFDGVDEFSAKEDIARKDHTCYKNGLEEKMPVSALFNKLASGKLFRGLNIITTTRPTAVTCVEDVKFDRTVEILGFTSEKVEDYVEKFTQGVRNAKDKIWGHIKSNMNLFSLCYIPVNCFLICSCLWEIISLTDTAHTFPTRMTDIYAMVVKIAFFKHNRQSSAQGNLSLKDYMYLPFNKLPDDHKEIFKRLGDIAFEGVKQGRLLLESSEVSGLEDCGLLHRLPDAKFRWIDPPKAQYCFTHLTVQEFFAAKHVVESFNKSEFENFVSERINDGAWQVVLQFVAGLLEPDPETKSSSSDIFIKLLPMSTEKKSEQELVNDYDLPDSKTLTCWPVKKDKELALNLCKCLYEIHEKQQAVLQNKIEQIVFNAVDFSYCSLAPVDFAALSHFLENASGVLSMDLWKNDLGSLGSKELQKFLVNTECQLNSLNLRYNELTDEAAEHLAAALKDINCKLNSLDLASNKLTDKGAEHLAAALKDSNCKLKSLNLGRNELTNKGAEHLAAALKHSNCKLNTLNLVNNKLTDRAAEHLAAALKHSNCKLNSLNLGRIELTDKGAEYLAAALKHSNCKLNSLNLSGNSINDKAAFTKAVEHNNCLVLI